MRERRSISLSFPHKGLNIGYAKKDQPPGTCIECQNVRAFDPFTGRNRGAQRPGLSKYCSAQTLPSSVQDDSGNDNHPTLNGSNLLDFYSTQIPSGASGGSMLFSSTDSQYLEFATEDLIDTDTTWSMSFWIRLNSTGAQCVYGEIEDGGAESTRNYVFINASSKVEVQQEAPSGSDAVSTTALDIDTWYHVAITNNATNTIIYINGSSDSTTTQETYSGDPPTHGRIGFRSAANPERLDAYLDDFRIYGDTLTGDEVTFLYNSHTGGTGGTDPTTADLTVHLAGDGSAVFQCLTHVVTVNTAASDQSQLNNRTVTPIAVQNGRVMTFNETAFSTATNGENALNANAPLILSTTLGDDVYFADGTTAKYYDTSADTVQTWSASAGSLPSSSGNTPRLIETWRARIVLSGIKNDPRNWFMSAVGSATDWDYAATPDVVTLAVAGTVAPAGLVGDSINCLIPYNDDLLIFGCDSSIWVMAGDPKEGGRIDRISDVTGMAFGRPWCKDPFGRIYFFGSRGGVYRMTPGEPPERITANSIEELLQDIDLNANTVRMVWNDRSIGVNLFIVPLSGSAARHLFYDARNDGWFLDQYANPSFSPRAVHVLDGDTPDDRHLLLGGQDGYIRRINHESFNDDGEAIDSRVMLGPITSDGYPFVITEIQAILAENEALVGFNLFVGDSEEHVFSSDAGRGGLLELEDSSGLLVLEDGSGFLELEGEIVDFSGQLAPIRSQALNPRKRGYAAYVELFNENVDEKWGLESLLLKLNVITSSKSRRL